MIDAKKRYEDAKKKLGELQNERDDVQRRIEEIDGKVRDLRNKQTDSIETAAKMLLTGEYKRPDDINPLFQARDDLAIRRKVLLEAIRLQEEVINNAKIEYSRIVGKSRRQDYVAIGRQTVKAVIDLSRAIERENTFRDELIHQDVSFNMAFGNPINFTKHGILSDQNSRASMYLREVARSGLLSKEEIEKLKAVG